MSNELNPGTRVKITGWQFPSKSARAKATFRAANLKIGCAGTIVPFFGGIALSIDTDLDTQPWDIALFTYEILTDGND